MNAQEIRESQSYYGIRKAVEGGARSGRECLHLRAVRDSVCSAMRIGRNDLGAIPAPVAGGSRMR